VRESFANLKQQEDPLRHICTLLNTANYWHILLLDWAEQPLYQSMYQHQLELDAQKNSEEDEDDESTKKKKPKRSFKKGRTKSRTENNEQGGDNQQDSSADRDTTNDDAEKEDDDDDDEDDEDEEQRLGLFQESFGDYARLEGTMLQELIGNFLRHFEQNSSLYFRPTK
jgi:hypothetical protein